MYSFNNNDHVSMKICLELTYLNHANSALSVAV